MIFLSCLPKFFSSRRCLVDLLLACYLEQLLRASNPSADDGADGDEGSSGSSGNNNSNTTTSSSWAPGKKFDYNDDDDDDAVGASGGVQGRKASLRSRLSFYESDDGDLNQGSTVATKTRQRRASSSSGMNAVMESPLLSRVGAAAPSAKSPVSSPDSKQNHDDDGGDDEDDDIDSNEADEEDERVLAAAFARPSYQAGAQCNKSVILPSVNSPVSTTRPHHDADDFDLDLADEGNDHVHSSTSSSAASSSLTRDEVESSLRVLIETYPSEVSIAWAAPRLLRTGQIKLLLRLAHARREMPLCLEALATHGMRFSRMI